MSSFFTWEATGPTKEQGIPHESLRPWKSRDQNSTASSLLAAATLGEGLARGLGAWPGRAGPVKIWIKETKRNAESH